jgi:hypothetical protein
MLSLVYANLRLCVRGGIATTVDRKISMNVKLWKFALMDTEFLAIRVHILLIIPIAPGSYGSEMSMDMNPSGDDI